MENKQQLWTVDRLDTGLLMLPQAIASGLTSPLSAMLGQRFGVKPVLYAGLLNSAVTSVWVSAIDLNTNIAHLQWLLDLRGIGIGHISRDFADSFHQANSRDASSKQTHITAD